MGEDEAGTAGAVREHREAARPMVADRGGRIVKTRRSESPLARCARQLGGLGPATRVQDGHFEDFVLGRVDLEVDHVAPDASPRF